MKPLFVTSSGTEVGKTLVTGALAWQLRQAGRSVRAIKPVISGFAPETLAGSDSAILLASVGLEASQRNLDTVSPWRFAAPLSPDMAAAREGRSLSLPAIVDFCRACAKGPEDVLLVEGVGGVMVPLNAQETVLDWICAFGAPALLVVGSYLGTISHTLTALAALRARNVEVRGIVISESSQSPVPPAQSRETLARFCDGAPLLIVPRIAGPDPWQHAPDLIAELGLG